MMFLNRLKQLYINPALLRLLFYNRAKYYKIFIVLSFLVGVAGCDNMEVENKDKEEMVFNSVVEDPEFQQMLQTHTIHLISPGSGLNPVKIPKLQSLPFLKLLLADNLITDTIPYHSNTDEERFKMLKEALYDPNNSIVWTLRGGYGSARLIDYLRKLPPPKKEKLFIAFSDNTALHLYLSQIWGWKTIHGAGLAALLNPKLDPENFLRLGKIISGQSKNFTINLQPLNEAAKRIAQKISGKLTGGNIAIIQTSIGTDWQIQTENKIVFLEEVNEKGYQVDRMLHHLKEVGIFKNVKAIVLGDFIDMRDEWVDFAIQRFAAETNIPVYKTDEFGHGTKNYPLIYNSNAEIENERLKISW